MGRFSKQMKNKITGIINDMADHAELFSENPGHDFTRERSLNFRTMVSLIMSIGGNSLTKELYDFAKNGGKGENRRNAHFLAGKLYCAQCGKRIFRESSVFEAVLYSKLQEKRRSYILRNQAGCSGYCLRSDCIQSHISLIVR